MDKIEDSIDDYEEINKDTNIVVYCKSGIRSKEAASLLAKLEYKNVNDLGSISNCN